MDYPYKVQSFIADSLVHLLQPHSLYRTHAYTEIGCSGPGLVGIEFVQLGIFSVKGLEAGHEFFYIRNARGTHIVSPLVLVAIHLNERSSAQKAREALAVVSNVALKPLEKQIHKDVSRDYAIQVKIPKGQPFQFELAVAFKHVDNLLHFPGHNLIHLTAYPHLVKVVVGIVVLDKAGHFKKGGIVCISLVENLFRACPYKVPEQSHVPFHEMGHPLPGFFHQIIVQLLHQLALFKPDIEVTPQDICQILEFRLLESAQYGVQAAVFHLCVLIFEDGVAGCRGFIRA